jgi:general secretion pathway protein E
MKKLNVKKTRPVRAEFAPQFQEAAEELENESGAPHRIIDLVEPLLLDAFPRRVSDIHIEPQSFETRVRFRVDGTVGDVASVSHQCGKFLINQLKVRAGMDPVIRFTPTDAHTSLVVKGTKLDLRLALAPSQHGETMAVRILNAKRLERNIDTLGLSEANLERIEQWIENASGMFLVAGPTGSGKTTTLYSLLHIFKHGEQNIISLEDPVEYAIDGITQIQIDELHNLTFAEGVKSLLRLDPDLIMLGEIRDDAAAQSAMNAAISGRILLSTIHSRDAVGALASLRNWGLRNHEIAESLMLVVAQRLVRKLCPECRDKKPLEERDARWLRAMELRLPRAAWYPVGCAACHGVGYRDRTGVFELWKLTWPDYEMILKNADEQSIRRHLGERNHSSLLQDGIDKITTGVTSIAEIRRTCST